MLSYILLLSFPAVLLAAAISDLLTMKIPNRLPLGLIAIFPVAALLCGMDAAEFGMHLAIGFAVLAVCFAMFAMNWIGGGDAKLAAAIAVWFGPSAVLLQWSLLAAIFGGALTLAILVARRMPLPLVLATKEWVGRLHHPKTGIPYGIALSAAGLTLYPATEIFRAIVEAGQS